MNTNHTPGPWVVKNSGESNYFTIADSKANWLMQIQHNGEQYAAIQDANARLIAAAPELLDALLLCQTVLHPGAVGMITLQHGIEHGQRAVYAVLALRAAIAKASGQ